MPEALLQQQLEVDLILLVQHLFAHPAPGAQQAAGQRVADPGAEQQANQGAAGSAGQEDHGSIAGGLGGDH